MDSTKYIGMDVHKESISIAVRNAAGKVVMRTLKELVRSYLTITKASRSTQHPATEHPNQDGVFFESMPASGFGL